MFTYFLNAVRDPLHVVYVPHASWKNPWIQVTIYTLHKVILTRWNGKVLRVKQEMSKVFKTNPIRTTYKIGVS